MIPDTPKNNQKKEDEEYRLAGRLPTEFDPYDSNRIMQFAHSLLEARMRREMTQSKLADAMDMTSMAISKYERGKIKCIPMGHLRRLCATLEVTPHYLLGYVEDEGGVLSLDENGEVQYDESGKVKTRTVAMIFTPASTQAAYEAYNNLVLEDPDLFWDIYKVITAKPDKKYFYKKVLHALL